MLPSGGINVTVSAVAVSANTVLLVNTAEKAALSLIKLLNVRASVPMFDTTIVMLSDVDGYTSPKLISSCSKTS